MYKPTTIQEREAQLKKTRKADLKDIVKQFDRLAWLGESSKWDLIGDILRYEYGLKALKTYWGD